MTPPPKGILELDRFSEESIEKWNKISADLDELNAVLYFNLEPDRRRHRNELLGALQQVDPVPYKFDNWVRIVDYQWTMHPLSAAGSISSIGGRFNAGNELDRNTLDAWPALYIAKDAETAYREKFQIESTQTINGLTAEELGLSGGKSFSTVYLKGELSRVFEMTPDNLAAVARVFAKIKMPEPARWLMKELKISDVNMVRNGKQLYDLTTVFNWRVMPAQFGLPAQSHILAELVRAAGFEAIAYPSSKGGGKCLAVFVDRLASKSYVQINGEAPQGAITILDDTTAEALAGWVSLGLRPPRP